MTTTSTVDAMAQSTALSGLGTPAGTGDETAKKALTTCLRAWNYAYRKLAEDEDSTEYDCQKAGDRAFLKAMPLLCGHKSICDFIACINYASLNDIVKHSEATHYLANVRIALAALGLKSKTQATGAKSDGKPPANSASARKE